METKEQTVFIHFFQTKRQDFLTSHMNGLDEEQVKMLHNVKVGDRLRIFVNPLIEGKSRLSMGVLVEQKAAL